MSARAHTHVAVLLLVGLLTTVSAVWAEDQPAGVAVRPCTADARAADEGPEHGGSLLQPVAMKLVRGVSNLTLGWLEFPKQVYCIWQERGWLRGITRGPIDGVGMLLGRMLAGAYEILTFPIPVPAHYQPMVKPDHVWQPEPPRVRDKQAQVG